MEPSQPQSSPLKAPSITISPSKNHVMERVISQQLNSSPGPQWATENNPHPKAGGSYAGGSPAPSVDGLVDVDEEIDELLGDDDVQEGAEEKDGEPEKHKCHWGQCQDDFDSKQEFYGHVKGECSRLQCIRLDVLTSRSKTTSMLPRSMPVNGGLVVVLDTSKADHYF